MLRAQPSLQVYIVGHTDNVGTLAYNLNLSERRARAVVAAPTSQCAIARAPGAVRLLTPVASDATAAGQGKNRRVEPAAQ